MKHGTIVESYLKRARTSDEARRLDVRHVCESLESRILLSKVGPLIDAGDVRWLYSENRPEHVLRATDLVLVGFGAGSSSSRVHRLSAALTGKYGALAGYKVLQAFNVTSVLFQRTARGNPPSLDSLLAGIRGFPNIKHLSPTFFNVPDYQRIVIFDTVFAVLRNGADSASVFAKGFTSVTPLGQNSFGVTLRRGGAVDALRVAETLRQKSYIDGVGADTASIPILASAPNDAHYTNGDQWNLPKVNLPGVWDNKSTGSADVVTDRPQDAVESGTGKARTEGAWSRVNITGETI